jgi:hypothetical protein
LKRLLSAVGALVGTSAIAVSSLVVTAASANADTGDGTLLVNIVDQYNRPTVGVVEIIDPTGDIVNNTGPGSAASSVSSTIPAGGYALLAITPWSGFTCAGVATCSPLGTSTVTPAVTVTAGQQTTYTMRVIVPSITGSAVNGSQLSVQLPQGLATLEAYPYGGYYGGALSPVQWQRDGADIPGAMNMVYSTVPSDGGHSLSARLTPSPNVTAIFGEEGMSVTPLTTNAIAVQNVVRAKTKTKIKVAKRIRSTQRASVKVRIKSAHKVTAGYVTVKVGKFKTKKAVQDGTVFVSLPRLKAGHYKVVAKYLGATAFAKSKAKKVKITVRR